MATDPTDPTDCFSAAKLCFTSANALRAAALVLTRCGDPASATSALAAASVAKDACNTATERYLSPS